MKTKVVRHVPRIIFSVFKFSKTFLVPSFCLTFRHFSRGGAFNFQGGAAYFYLGVFLSKLLSCAGIVIPPAPLPSAYAQVKLSPLFSILTTIPNNMVLTKDWCIEY